MRHVKDLPITTENLIKNYLLKEATFLQDKIDISEHLNEINL